MADLTTDQRVAYSIVILDSHTPPRPAAVDGVPVVASSDETVLSVEAAADGMSGFINAVAAGTARISITADADLGAGVEEIVGVSEDINVTASPLSKAHQFTITLGAPEDKA